MATGWLGAELVHLVQVDSTNDELRRRARAGASHGLVVFADRQTDGRGRQGRIWTGGEGNLLVSWLLRFVSPPDDLPALSIVQGLALARALDRWVPGRVQLKWPNDLLLDGRKVGGLLLETRTGDGIEIVNGLGINLARPTQGWGELDGRATSLEEATGQRPEARAQLAELLPELEAAVDHFLEEGALAALQDWSRWSALDGRTIEWDDGGRIGRGLVLGIAHDGGLRVETHDRTVVLYAGDVHLTEVP
jgi:BirA family biotin operon repressor/biotin-[acetyl-CoA-carboxylase] ligase